MRASEKSHPLITPENQFYKSRLVVIGNPYGDPIKTLCTLSHLLMTLNACDLSSLSPEDAVRALESFLPPVRELPTLSEVDYYGAADVIAERVGLPVTPATIPGAVSWHHGPARPPLWGLGEPDPPIPEAEMDYAFYMAPRGALRLLVHEKEEVFFESLGSVTHLAVGAPFCYVPPSEIPRVSGALLAMPSHSFVGGVSNHQLELANRYAAYIEGLRKSFPFVCVCLYSDDYTTEAVREIYLKHSLPVVRGAGIADHNSLRRIRRLFEIFDYMTSNAFGSHVVYASSAGCRPFLTDHAMFGNKRTLWEKHPYYASRPNLLSNVLKVNEHEFVRKKWPWLYDMQHPATANTSWANDMLGMRNVRSPLEVARLLGWRYPFSAEPSRETFLKFSPLLGCAIGQQSDLPETAQSTWRADFKAGVSQAFKALKQAFGVGRT